ncbi:hypothetical protein H4582DRAFT_2130608 [Lactarius indigo]|nr:hypothetical protein H4582DRAFT_2130608 [Lactarius indigo]
MSTCLTLEILTAISEEIDDGAEKDGEKFAQFKQTFFDLRGENWTDLRQAVLDRLKSENMALLQHLPTLENAPINPDPDANGEGQLMPVSRAGWTAVFAGKTAEFREVLSVIFGVKLVFYDNGQVRVTSQYDLGATFIFQPSPKDEGGGKTRLQLVVQGEGGSLELLQLMRNWVEIKQGIPCFSVSFTLESYDEWKRKQQ